MEEVIEEIVLVKTEPEEAVDYPFPQIEVIPSPLDINIPTETQMINKFCRLCLRELPNLFPLMSRIQDVMIPEMVEIVTGSGMNLQDTLPKKVCINCLTKLDYAYNIRIDFLESYQILKSLAQSKIRTLVENLSNYQKGIRVATETYAERILRQNRDVLRMRLIKKQEYLSSLSGDEMIEELDNESSVEHIFTVEPENDSKLLVDVKEEPELVLDEDEPVVQNKKADNDTSGNDQIPNAESEEDEINSAKKLKKEKRKKSRRYNMEMKESKLDPNKCYICEEVFTDIDKLKVHLPDHLDMIPYTCERCIAEGGEAKKLTSLILLHRHFRMHASSIKCPECPFRTCTATGLYGHVQRYHGKDTKTEYTCEVCGFKLVNRWYFDNHMRSHKAVEEGRYTCSFCEKRFATRGRLIRHERCHTNERPYQCKYCVKSFTNETTLHGHERIHTGEKGYQCELCGKSYRIKNSLREHLASVHVAFPKTAKKTADQRKYVNFNAMVACAVEGCNFITKSRTQYYNHKAKHDLKFQCSECSQRFPTGQRLEQHQFVHTGTKPYCCELCGKSFRYKNSFNEHLAGHGNVRPFSCEICGMSFVRERTLKEHRLKHSDKLTYECRHCDKKFKYRADQSKHERTHMDATANQVLLQFESPNGMDIIVEDVEIDD